MYCPDDLFVLFRVLKKLIIVAIFTVTLCASILCYNSNKGNKNDGHATGTTNSKLRLKTCIHIDIHIMHSYCIIVPFLFLCMCLIRREVYRH